MKITNLLIENFRRFQRFRIDSLGRVNLLVGTNNSGKTSVLEAANLLLAGGDPSVIRATLMRRGELIHGEREPSSGRVARQVDVRRLFLGHAVGVGASFQISAGSDAGRLSLSAEFTEFSPSQQSLFEPEATSDELAEEPFPPMALTMNWTTIPGGELRIPIGRLGGASFNVTYMEMQRLSARSPDPIRFINASSLTADAVARLFEDVVLTPGEDLVVDALRIIEPGIERIASTGSERLRSGARVEPRGGILVKLNGIKDRVPIGSMGDGIWRMLGLALAAVQTQNGVLLVDEIDTGLHHAVMEDLWRFLHRCALRYNIQILASTHSLDCVRSLAAICRDDVSEGSEVTISRIERGRDRAVSYTEQEIVAVAEREIEVR